MNKLTRGWSYFDYTQGPSSWQGQGGVQLGAYGVKDAPLFSFFGVAGSALGRSLPLFPFLGMLASFLG